MARIDERGQSESGLDGNRHVSRLWQAPAVLDALTDPVIVVEHGSGQLLLANRAARQAHGLLTDGGSGDWKCGILFDADGRELTSDNHPLRRAARGEAFAGLRVSCQAAEGARTVYQVSASSVAPGRAATDGQADSMTATVVRFTDVTELLGVETALRESVQARDEFVSIATHELKEPLAAILLSLQLLEMCAENRQVISSGEVLETVGVLRRQGGRLSRLVENLLDVSRINNARLQIDREVLDFCDLVRTCVAHFTEEARRAGSELTFHGCDQCLGYFDYLRMEQVVGNLVSNAIKYGGGRPITVRVDADAETVKLEVADQGIGIAPADQLRIFDRFERATRGHLRRSLGLGLYIVRAIVQAHGGSVRLRSAVGVGSTFTVELPRRHLPERSAGAVGLDGAAESDRRAEADGDAQSDSAAGHK